MLNMQGTNEIWDFRIAEPIFIDGGPLIIIITTSFYIELSTPGGRLKVLPTSLPLVTGP